MLPTLALSAAIATAVASQHLGDGCSATDLKAAIAHADAKPLGSLGKDPVVLVSLGAACMCGNVNCPWLVLRTGFTTAVLYRTYAFDVGVERAGEALPRLRSHAHDSALITDDELDAYRNGRYVPIVVERVRGDTGARKPDTVAVRFATGASSARLYGSVATGWYDEYTFVVARGQRLTISGVTGAVSLSLIDLRTDRATELHPGIAFTLPRSGTFRLLVDGTGEKESPYALTLEIK